MLAVVVTDVAGEGEYRFERRKFGATPDQLHLLAQWLVQQALVLDHTELAMLLAVFVPPVDFQMRRYRQNGRVLAH